MNPLRDLDLDRYANLIVRAIGATVSGGIRDSRRRFLCTFGEMAEELQAYLDAPNAATTFDRGRLLTHALTVGDTSYGELIVLVPSDRLRVPKDAQATRALTVSIVECITGALRLALDLDAMAVELAGRYEELNLVYEIDEKARRYANESSRTALVELVRDCAEHLDLESAMLSLPEDDLEITHFASEADAGANEGWRNLKHDLLVQVRSVQASVVLNEPDDPRWAVLGGAPRGKLTACPIRGAGGAITGVFAVGNEADGPDFSNGDRKLLEVLADQVCAIVRIGRDSLTGLLNRRGLEQRLQDAKVDDRGSPGRRVLLYINVDRFRLVNEMCGRVAGDELIKQVAALIDASTRDRDLIARVNADEFVAVLTDCPLENATVVADKLLDQARMLRFAWDGRAFNITVSVGVLPLDPGADQHLDDLLSYGESASLVARHQGRDRYHVFREGDDEATMQHSEMRWVPRINEALEADRFELFGQIIAPLDDALPDEVHLEALLRYVDDDGKLVGPFAFIPAAERFELMPAIDKWVIGKTLALLAEYRTVVVERRIVVAINLSGQSVAQADFADFIEGAIRDSNLDSSHVSFEVTETATVGHLTAAREFIKRLRAIGCQFALDDFGTGLSSFSYLKNLPVDYLKIDGAFVKEIVTDPVSAAMVEAISQIAKVMGLKTVAEFVENEEIVARLRQIGVHYAQGYGIAKPRSLRDQLEEIESSRFAIAVGGHG